MVPSESSALLAPRLPQLWGRLTTWTHCHPDVSSFYRLATILLDRTDVQGGAVCRPVVTSYLQDLLQRTRIFRQAELSVSALSLVAVIPPQLLVGASETAALLPPVLPQLWQLGVSVPQLAQAGLQAVHRWLDCLDEEENGGEQVLDKLLTATLPHLRPFLAYRPPSTAEDSILLGQKRKRGRPKPADTERMKANMAAQRSLEEANCGLALELVARVATRHKQLVLLSVATSTEAATLWDHRKHLRFDIPMPDANVPLYLDHMLPTILDLIQPGTERKTRTAAAELLHAVVTVMVGQTAAHTEEIEARAPMSELFKRVLPALLDLASDSDSVIQGLFRPLFSQLIHWFTKVRKYESPETVCLLNSLFDVVCDSKHDGGRKREAAAYIGEFSEWSIRQAIGGGKKGGSGRHNNIRSILNRLYFLWRHPDVDKRAGACLAFGQLYRLLREEEAVVSEHLLDILAAAMACLRLAHCDDVGNREIVELARTSLDHVKRILLHYLGRGKFTAADETSVGRRVPPDMRGGDAVHILEWLLGQAHGDATEARHYAMEMFHQLASRLRSSHPSPTTLAQDMLLARYGSLAAYIKEVEDKAALREIKLSLEEGEPERVLACMQALQAVFENYHWLLGE